MTAPPSLSIRRPVHRWRSFLFLFALVLACVRTGPKPSLPPMAPPDAEGESQAERFDVVEPLAPRNALPPEGPVLVRVGLSTDLEEVVLPCCDGEVTAELGAKTLELVSPIKVEPLAKLEGKAVYRIQVVALREQEEALALAERIRELTGKSCDARFDAAAGLYRVRVGRYPDREVAESAQRELESRGIRGTWIATEGGGIVDPVLLVSQRGETFRVEGRWLAVRGSESGGVRVAGKRYRGRILIYLNDRGMLNVINELDLEDYLRGVVPKEMGPAAYPEIESLRAQAVAARTYLLRNRGGFPEEGFDICATPRCQVYQGMETEHTLSDQAIRDTAGQVVLSDGWLADTLYSSTCGGHTENVEVVFPQRHPEPYLEGVPCIEAGLMSVSGSVRRGTPFPGGLMARILPPNERRDPVARASSRIVQLAVLAGLSVPRDQLASLERREVNRFVGSVFDMALSAQLFVRPEELGYLLGDVGDAGDLAAGWSEQDRRLAGYLARTGLSVGQLDRPLTRAEVDETLFQLALYVGVLEESTARFLALRGEKIRVRENDEIHDLDQPPLLATFRLQGNRSQAADLRLVPGDQLVIYRSEGEILAMVQKIHPGGAGFDRKSRWTTWRKFRTDRQIAEGVGTRFPGLEVEDIQILRRGVSGRVGAVRVVGKSGRTEVVEGLPIRWMLGVPDTLFTLRRARHGSKGWGWQFHGRGLGHGVGMCQVGAYGMAQRGHSYREILAHYYQGTSLGKVKSGGV